ncbi:MAG TPA: DUF2817 domain-containing protein [bacterium]|nr:DUF2817 domain-containing protein [bacterium]HPR86739.1 DUF2817 domain-containing protein [bacterium]
MLKRILLTVLSCLAAFAAAPAQELPTPGEANGFSRYTQHDQILQFLTLLTARCKTVQVMEIGKTRPVEEYAAESLLLCVVTAAGASRPEQLDRSRITILITASQHGSEQSGKEAALALLRDLALGDLQPLLQKANFLIIPQANPWGNHKDRRVNELGLDMNRDHIKMESEGVQAIHRVFRAWMPEVTLDVHERGDDYYQVTVGCVSNVNVDPAIESYSRQVILTEVAATLARDKITFHEYLVTSENMPSDASGADFTREELARWPQITRRSTSDLNDGRNSLGIYQTFSFIQEGASRHDLATLAARTRYQGRSIRAFIKTVAAHGPEMASRVRTLRQQLLAGEGAFGEVHLQMAYRRDPAQPELRLREFREEKRKDRVLKVDKKAGERIAEEDLEPLSDAAGPELGERIEKEWYPAVVPTLSVARPLGYVIPAAQAAVIAALRLHDIEMMMFTRDAEVKAEGYWTQKVVPSRFDYVAPESLQVEARPLALLCRKGDIYIPCRQPAAQLLPCLLEPQSDYGLIRYWKFHLVPEAGNYYALYRIVAEQDLPLAPWCRWPR